MLLSLCTTPKEYLGNSPVTLALRHSPLLPGAFVSPTSTPDVTFLRFPHHLSSSSPGNQPGIPHALDSASHIFIRVDTHCAPLDAPYHGPYAVLSCDEKTITISLRGEPEVVSLDSVKPAYLPPEDVNLPHPVSPPLQPQPTTSETPPMTPPPTHPFQLHCVTQSGQPVTLSARFH